MDAIRERLKQFEFFNSLDPDAFEAILEHCVWRSLAGGWELFGEGDVSDTLFFNISGRLVVVRKSIDGDEVVGYVRAGEPVGEMSILSGEDHTASVYALRDTEVISIPRAFVDQFIHEHGEFAGALARVIVNRSRDPAESFQRSAPRVFAILATSPSIDPDAHAEALAQKIERYGLKVTWLPVCDDAMDSAEFDRLEESHDVVLLASRLGDTSWYRFVLRHADRFLVLARRDAVAPRPFPLTTMAGSRVRKFRLVDLVMLNEGESACSVLDWVDTIGAARVFNCSGDPCMERLARLISGKSIGLVLSGGGARAYAHIGAIRALREAGIPIDFVCGVSMGAVIAACVAMGWREDKIESRIRETFVDSNPLGDHVLPVVALTKGGRVDRRLQRHFDDALIENLPIPYLCASSNLVTGEPRIHNRGILRHALRASIALPGILPPVVDGDALLVDGAVINNFPTGLMAAMHRGLTIGIDVTRQGTIDVETFVDPPGFFSWISKHGVKSAPPIISLLMRTVSARHERTLKIHPADIMIAPEVPGVGLRHWTNFDEAVSNGYMVTRAAIEENWHALSGIVDAAGRVERT